ncbi:MAG: hypothetical protein HOH43_18955 [Candidatus Latescibacteria bacterium]|nr:hypothetical protein [Candidatus Latescibacterota bacterium]
MIRPVARLAKLVSAALLFAACGSKISPTADPATWQIAKPYLYTGYFENATNPYIEDLTTRLSSSEGPGTSMSKSEFVALIDRPESREVYSEKLIKIATPKSVEIQNQEHSNFLNVFMREKRLVAGVSFLSSQSTTLTEAEQLYGVAQQDIVSILMWESGLGEFTGNLKVFNVLMGQLLFLDVAAEYAIGEMIAAGDSSYSGEEDSLGRQEERFDRIKKRCVNNLVALLRQSKSSGTDPLGHLGSWGGAIGYPQFMPFSMVYAVDGDGDGKVDLHTWPDAIMSVGNYLKQRGEYGPDLEDRRGAIHSYNPIDSYVDGVIAFADTIWARHQAAQ